MPVDLLLPRVKVPVLPLLTYKKLDMAFGVGAGASLFDKSRYRSHGAITTATWAAGVHGYCLDFNKANPDNVAIPAAHTQLDFTAEDFSMIARIRLETFAATAILIGRGKANTDGWQWVMNNAVGNLFSTMQAGPQQNSYSAAGDLLAGVWYTVGVSRDGASVKVFIDGVDKTGTAGVHIDPLTNNRIAYIGTKEDGLGQPLDGKIEFLRIFGGIALATSEHLAWHNALA